MNCTIKLRLLVFFILLSGNLFAQKTRKLVHQFSNGGITESYEVLKSDTSIKNGTYKFQGVRFLTTGYFKNNQKDSIWTSYGFGRISSTGSYKDGVRYGVWSFYNYKGELQNEFDFSNNKTIFHKRDLSQDSLKYAVINGNDTLYTLVDRPPTYEGGEAKISGIMVSNVRYPARAKENGTTGKVIIAVTIDENGHLINYRVKKQVKDGLSEEALRVIRLIDNNWIPALLNNKPVVSEYCFPVNFNLVK